MQTKKFKDLTHEFEAKVDDVIEGMLYKDSSNSWYIFHNGSSYKGGWPADFEKLKKEYGVTSSWYLGNENSDTESVHSIVTHKPRKDIEEGKADKDALRASRRAEKRAEQKAKDAKTIFGEPEDGEAPEKVTDVSRFVSGANVTFYKKLYGSTYSSSTGQLYYSGEGKRWYVFSNNPDFNGDKPSEWSELKEKGEFKYSFLITTSGKNKLHYEESYITFSPVVRKPEPEPEQAEEDKIISIDYSTLEEGAEVLFAVDDYNPKRKLPTRGKLLYDEKRWYVLHNDDNKNGAFPTTPIHEKFGGEFSLSWHIGSSRDPYTRLIRFEILSRPKEKIADVPKDRFAVGCTITCLTPDQFEDKLKMKRFSHSGAFELYAGKKATVERNTSEREVAVKWFDGIIYNMSKNEFQEFYPEYLGRVVTIEETAPTPEKEEPKVRLPLFSNGMVLTCLTEEQFKSKLGRAKFYHGGEFERLSGTKCIVTSQQSDGLVNVKWMDYDTHSYIMNINEFKEYYPELKYTTESSKVSIPEDSGIGWKIMQSTMSKFAVPDHVVKMDSMSIPTDHIDALSYSLHIKGDTHWEDKFKPDASYEYTPPVHPSSSKLRATSDSDIKGDSVPRKKNIDTLLILGL